MGKEQKEKGEAVMATQPFTIEIADEVLEDMRRRIADTRWPG